MVTVTDASIATPKCSPVSAFNPDGTSTASTGIFAALTAAMIFFQFLGKCPVQADAKNPVDDQCRLLLQFHFQLEQVCLRQEQFQHLDLASIQKFLGCPGVIAIVALARKDKNKIIGIR